MNLERDIALVDELRSHTSECQWLEFKKNNTDHEMIGKRCSALSNAARIDGRDTAYMLWGIEDETHKVVGTSFDPESQKAGGMVLQLWLANALQPSITFSFRTIEHPDGRVVLLEIPAATGTPISFNGIAYGGTQRIRYDGAVCTQHEAGKTVPLTRIGNVRGY